MGRNWDTHIAYSVYTNADKICKCIYIYMYILYNI